MPPICVTSRPERGASHTPILLPESIKLGFFDSPPGLQQLASGVAGQPVTFAPLGLDDPALDGFVDPYGVAVLIAGMPLTKTFGPGGVEVRSYPLLKHFDYCEVSCQTPEALCRLLCALQRLPRICVVRAGIRPDRVCWRGINRLLKEHRDREFPDLVDSPRAWVCGDIDGLPMPDGLSYADPEGVARYALGTLPDYLRDAACVYQFSVSAAIRKPHLIKVHLWFLLTRPYKSVTLREWMKTIHVDSALSRCVQPIYTAPPGLTDGATDPLPHRVGLIPGRVPAADIDAAVRASLPKPRPKAVRARRTAAGRTWTMPTGAPQGDAFAGWLGIFAREFGYTRPDGSQGEGYYNPIFSLLLSYFAHGGLDVEALKARLRTDVTAYRDEHDPDKVEVDDYLSDDRLDCRIEDAMAFVGVEEQTAPNTSGGSR